ncbi:MAG: DinB family protein [Bacteroidetes bacterium]|nr:DinB family protein [Bacteroidota bacterium]MCW5894573.1 DinB family protein [Bacteroidota bacterium]
MTTEVDRLEDQLRRALEGEAWHGPSVLELLTGISATQAASHPIAGAHSIWEVVLHLANDYDLVLRRLAGDGRQLTAAEDWPACPASTEENWQQTLQELKRLNNKLRQAVRDFPVGRLDDPLVPEVPYTAYTQFIGVTQHNLYHAGQIALLKRALASSTAA